MKNIYRLLSIGLLITFLTGCFDDPGSDIVLTKEFVSASDPSLQTLEGGEDAILVEISQAQSQDVVVNYTITDNNTVNGVDYELTGNSVTIPAGEYSATIPYEVVPNLIFEGVERTFTVTLEEANGIPIDGVNEVTVTLIDDDCEFTIADWEGVYSVEEVFTSGTNEGLSLASAFGESYQVELTADPSDPSMLTASWTNSEGHDTYFEEGQIMRFDVCDVEVSFEGDPLIANFDNLVVTSSSFDETAKTIRVDGNLGPYGPYGFTLTLE